MPIRVSLIIPTYNRSAILADTIGMAAAQDYDAYEVIVVDQDPIIPDVVKQAISATGGRARVLRLPRPSLTAARNAGVRAAKGEIVIFIDDDVVIGPEYIAGHVKHFEEPTIGGVMGLTLPSTQCDADDEINTALRRFEARRFYQRGTAQVSWILGGNTSYRKTAIVEAGMSDERFTGSAWSEDADLAVRVGHLGYQLLFDPSIRLIHLEAVAGGCENRVADVDEERKVEERCRMYLFFCFKNRAILGVLTTVHNVWKSYRHYSMNRSSIRTWRRFANRQTLFLRSLVGALRLVRTEWVRTDSDCQEMELSRSMGRSNSD